MKITEKGTGAIIGMFFSSQQRGQYGYDTPSGYLWTATDKFIWHYVQQGYMWEYAKDIITGYDDNIIFRSLASKKLARAIYNDKNHVCAYEVEEIA